MDELYRENILEHYKRPHNWGELESPSVEFEDNNPLCGDILKVQLQIAEDGTIEELRYEQIATIMQIDQDEAEELVQIAMTEMSNSMAGKVMVIEDETIIAMDLKGIVQSMGHDVTGIDTGFYRRGWLFDDGRTHPRVVSKDLRRITSADLEGFDAVVHLSELSNDPIGENDPALTMRINHEGSVALAEKARAAGVKRFIYASSAATYGDGAAGFDDDPALLPALRPLNLYGWTKHAFDLRVQAALAAGGPAPPQWAGLKFFNVYGPNEYHKGGMVSVVKVKWDEVRAGGAPRLFRSDREGVADGAQRRDFIWVGDVVDVLLWLLDTPEVSGLFNVGTGRARTYRDLARAVCDAAGAPDRVEFIDMPARLRGQYQSFTEAPMRRLRAAGYAGQSTPLEEGVRRYVQDHLARPDPYV